VRQARYGVIPLLTALVGLAAGCTATTGQSPRGGDAPALTPAGPPVGPSRAPPSRRGRSGRRTTRPRTDPRPGGVRDPRTRSRPRRSGPGPRAPRRGRCAARCTSLSSGLQEKNSACPRGQRMAIRPLGAPGSASMAADGVLRMRSIRAARHRAGAATGLVRGRGWTDPAIPAAGEHARYRAGAARPARRRPASAGGRPVWNCAGRFPRPDESGSGFLRRTPPADLGTTRASGSAAV
jgi:hypothetical protein